MHSYTSFFKVLKLFHKSIHIELLQDRDAWFDKMGEMHRLQVDYQVKYLEVISAKKVIVMLKAEKELGYVDGVSGATTNPQMQGKGMSINVSHIDPSKQALIDFRDNVINNKTPISNVHTGANTAKAVQLSLDAMYTNKIMYWD